MSDSEEKEIVEEKDGPVEEKVKKVSLTNLIIFILSCIVIILFVVQIAINTEERIQPQKTQEVTNHTSNSSQEEFDYQGTQRGTLVTK